MGTITVTSAGFGSMPNGNGTANGSLSFTLSDAAMQQLLNWADQNFPRGNPDLDANGKPLPRSNLQVLGVWQHDFFDRTAMAVTNWLKESAATTARNAVTGINIG